jgi:DNA damage-binding protein 1
MTHKLKFCILTYDPHRKQIATKAFGDLRDRIGRPSERGPILLVDPQQKMVAFFLVQGLLKVLLIESAGKVGVHFKEPFNIR